MSLTYLKETEAAYPDRLVSGHYPLMPLMPQRKYNVRANFTPTSNVPSEHPVSTPQALAPEKQAFLNAYDRSRRELRPVYHTPSSVSNSHSSIYTAAAKSNTAHHTSEGRSQCGCPSRRINVASLPPNQFNLFLEVLASVGDIEQEPEYESENVISLQFYDLRAAEKLAKVLPTILPLSGVTLRHVTLESDICVLIDIPWGQSVNYDGLLVPLKQYGSVSSLSFGKSHIGGPQQVVCVYHDVRDATKVLNKLITVNGVQLPVRLLSIPHTHVCPSASPDSQHQPQSSISGIGINSMESSMPAAFASSTTGSIPSLSSPYSTARTDRSSSYFNGVENPWLGKAADMGSSSHHESSLQRLSPQLIGSIPSTTMQSVTSRDLDADRSSQRLPTSRSMLDPTGSELFDGTYGPIGSAATSNVSSGNSVFDSILNSGHFGRVGTSDSMSQARHTFRAPPQLRTVDAGGFHDNGAARKSSDPSIVPTSRSQEVDKCMNILKRFATADAKAEPKETRNADRERCNDVDLEAIANGAETRTTVMLRNIPNKLDFKDLKRFLDATNRCTYDFLYLRFDFLNRCNVGYAFISFTKPKHVATFVKARAGMKWSQYNYNSEKIIEIKFARIQGRDSLIQKFRNSPVMSQDPAFKPRLYYTKGKLSGKEEPFPDPTIATTSKTGAS